MRSKGLIGLLAVTAASVAAAVYVSAGDGRAGDPQIGGAVLPEVSARLGEVTLVTLVHGDAKITLQRKDEDWVVEQKGGYPADALKLRQALLGLAELRFVEPKTRKPELYPRLDVEDAGRKEAKSTLVTVADAKGSLVGEIIAGKRRIDQLGGGNDGIYLRKPGDAQSWLARGTLDLPGDVAAWLDRKVVDVPEAAVKQVVLTPPGGQKITIARDKPEDMLALKDAPADAKLKSDTVLAEPAGALAGLELTDVRAAKDFGFPDEGASRAEYATFDGLTLKVELIEKDGAHWARLSAGGTGAAEHKAAELNAKLSPWVYAIAPYKANALMTKLADLVEPPKAS